MSFTEIKQEIKRLRHELDELKAKIAFLENIAPYNPKDLEEALVEVKEKTIEELIEENLMKEGWY